LAASSFTSSESKWLGEANAKDIETCVGNAKELEDFD